MNPENYKLITVVFTVADSDKHLLKDKLNEYSKFPIVTSETLGLGKARKECIEKVLTPYTLILDLDTDLPSAYLDNAVRLLKVNSNMVVVALDYSKSQGHYAFGTSLWKTSELKILYSFDAYNGPFCECLFMFNRVRVYNKEIGTLYMKAIHRGK